MNRNGQSLVLFVVIIPIILFIIFMIYDIGNMLLLRLELDDINYLALDYGLDKITEPDLETKLSNLITKNKSDIDKIEIDLEDNKITINLEDKLDKNVSLIKNVYTIKSTYTGSIIDNKKKITKG